MFGFMGRDKRVMVTPEDALPGRAEPRVFPEAHAVNGRSMTPPFPDGLEQAWFGMGCFWGAERRFWQQEGVWVTAVGYAAGYTENPTYAEVCSGDTGHNEVVRVVYDPDVVTFAQLLTVFWESHDPTRGMQQGNDVGTQYRSGIYWLTAAQRDAALASKEAYQRQLTEAGLGTITTEVIPAPAFYYAEGEHQGYLHKNPGGYCGLGGTGVSCPVGLDVPDASRRNGGA